MNLRIPRIKHFLFIVLITFFFPIFIFLKESGYNPYSWNELVIMLIMTFYFIYSIKINKKNKISSLYVFLLILYLLYQFILLFGSYSYFAGFSSILLHDKYIVLSILVFYFIDDKNEEILIKFIAIVAVAAVYIGLLKIINDPTILLSLYKNIGGFSRETSVFPNPNMFGIYILIVLFLELYIIEIIIERKYKILFLLVIFLPTVLSLLMTFSRRSWALFIVGFTIYFLFKKGKKVLFVTSFLLVCFILIQLIDYESIVNRFLLIFDSDYESNYERKMAFSMQIKIITSDFFKILGGDGIGMYGPNIIFTDSGHFQQIDNYYLQLILEFGFIGLLFYISIFLIVFIYSIKLLKNQVDNKLIYNKNLLYLIIICCLYISGIVGSTAISFPSSMLQWIIIGLILKNYSMHYERECYEKI